MIRPITPDDTTALIALAVESGLFPPDATEELGEVLADYFGGNIARDHFWVMDDEDGPVATAYYAPEKMTEGTWNVYLIAVRPDYQGQGRGAALMRHVEQALMIRGERLLLVETSGLPSFERARAFYRRCGYEEEARIRDFYTAGEDKIVYRKLLADQDGEYL